jgi:glutaredoxin
MMRHVVLYTREGCCLCDTAREVLASVSARHPSAFRLEERDIEADEALHRAYLERIPVIAIDGQEAFELFVDERALERRLGIVQKG